MIPPALYFLSLLVPFVVPCLSRFLFTVGRVVTGSFENAPWFCLLAANVLEHACTCVSFCFCTRSLNTCLVVRAVQMRWCKEQDLIIVNILWFNCPVSYLQAQNAARKQRVTPQQRQQQLMQQLAYQQQPGAHAGMAYQSGHTQPVYQFGGPQYSRCGTKQCFCCTAACGTLQFGAEAPLLSHALLYFSS